MTPLVGLTGRGYAAPTSRAGPSASGAADASIHRTIPGMPDVLIFADSIRSAEMRHEVPLAVPDPFLYAEQDGRRVAVASSMETARIAGIDGIETHAVEEYDYDELIR